MFKVHIDIEEDKNFVKFYFRQDESNDFIIEYIIDCLQEALPNFEMNQDKTLMIKCKFYNFIKPTVLSYIPQLFDFQIEDEMIINAYFEGNILIVNCPNDKTLFKSDIYAFSNIVQTFVDDIQSQIPTTEKIVRDNFNNVDFLTKTAFFESINAIFKDLKTHNIINQIYTSDEMGVYISENKIKIANSLGKYYVTECDRDFMMNLTEKIKDIVLEYEENFLIHQ